MKSKIVRQLGAMLLAGAMLVTSGNVTTYAAEQTDESVEVDETQEDELYSADMNDVQKLEEGDGYFICREVLNGKEKYVAYILLNKTDKNINEILNNVFNSRYMESESVVAITSKGKNIDIPREILEILKKRNMELKVVPRYYNKFYFYDIYFENINDTTENHDFDIEYNTDAEKIREIEDKGISGYTFTIINADKKNMYLLGKGTIEQKQLLDSNDLYKKITNYDNVKLYYYDEMMKKYVLVDSEIEFKCSKVENNEGAERSYVELKSADVYYYGTYLVCNNTLPDSMVFNFTGLDKKEDSLLYYKNGLRDTSYTGLCDYDGNTYYVKNGTVDYSANMLYDYNGSTWNIKNGKVDKTESVTMNNGSLVYTKDGKTSNETTLCKYNGEWYYIHNGKVDYNANTLCKYNGSWWYVQNGKVNFKYTGLCKYNGSWWYVSGGRVNFNATGLCKYNGSWWYVRGGRVNFNATGLCKYNGSWWYVSSGKVNFNATGLCKYNGSWWYVRGGRVNFNATGLCKYNGTWWYVDKGKVNFNYTGLCKYNGNWFYVENGAVKFKNTLCKYNGTWWYVNNGVVNFSKTTLCKYGKNWYAVSKGKVAWNYTGYMNYNSKKYKVVKGIVRF